jgi:hypothetical protein
MVAETRSFEWAVRREVPYPPCALWPASMCTNATGRSFYDELDAVLRIIRNASKHKLANCSPY